MPRFAALLLLLALTACSRQPARQTFELPGGTPERIAAVTRMLSRHLKLPSALLDAHFEEQKTGDGQLGPSDYEEFWVLKVAPADLPAWRAALFALEAQNTPPKYVAPRAAPAWWLPFSQFLQLEYHSPEALTGRQNGWVGLAHGSGEIFIYCGEKGSGSAVRSFTM